MQSLDTQIFVIAARETMATFPEIFSNQISLSSALINLPRITKPSLHEIPITIPNSVSIGSHFRDTLIYLEDAVSI